MYSLPNRAELAIVVEKAKKAAQNEVEYLGMANLLQEKKCWEYPPVPAIRQDELNNCEDDDDHEEVALAGDEIIPYLLEEANVTLDPQEIKSEVEELKREGVVDHALGDQLSSLQKVTFQRLPSTGLPTYERKKTSSKKSKESKFSHFVEVCLGNKSVYIHKTTAVWLLQEGERVSTDHLFRVRAKQPFSTEVCRQNPKSSDSKPTIIDTVSIGDVCAFKEGEHHWRLGRVLNFVSLMRKLKRQGNLQEISLHFHLATHPRLVSFVHGTQ